MHISKDLVSSVEKWAGNVQVAVELLDSVLLGKIDRKKALELRDLLRKQASELLKEYRPTQIVFELKNYLVEESFFDVAVTRGEVQSYQSKDEAQSYQLKGDAQQSQPKGHQSVQRSQPQPKAEATRERLKKFFEDRTEPGHVATKDDEKRRMAHECPACCGLIEDGICKYPVCGIETCERDCVRLDKSRVAARIQNKRKDFGEANRRLVNMRITEMCDRPPKCGRCDRVWKDA